jgi:Pentapeptide repeats (8 copies)
MNIRTAVVATLGAAALCSVAVSYAASPPPPATQASVTIHDSPGNNLIEFPPLTLTMAQLEALPASTVTLPDGTTESGPTLSSLLTQAGFQLISTCKNDQLHYWIEASSLVGSGAVISDGELDPLFGNNPAILSVQENGVPLTAPRLAVPNDKTTARDVGDVFDITVGRADQQLPQSGSNSGCTPTGYQPIATPPPNAGDVLINGAVSSPSAVVTWSQLMALPQVSENVSFLQGSNPQMRNEQGPRLYDVLSSAEPELTSVPSDDTRLYVEATSSEDGASALVSWDEFDPARNNNPQQPDLLSLGEAVLPSPPGAPFHLFIPPNGTDTGPRLTTPGDVRGGRYLFGVQIVTVFRAPVIPAPTAGTGPNLSGQNLSGTPLDSAYLVGATIQGANLHDGHLAGAILVNANLAGANLNDADLSNALLNGANLSGANLHDANLTGANLTGANLTGANLNGVIWSHTTCPDGTSSGDDGGTCSP